MKVLRIIIIWLSFFAVLPFIISITLRLQMGYAALEVFESERVRQTLVGGLTILVLLWCLYGLLCLVIWTCRKFLFKKQNTDI